MDAAAGVGTLIADRAYDANATRTAIQAAGCKGCIPPKANRVEPAVYDPHTFAKRHVVENFCEVLKRLPASPPDTRNSSKATKPLFTSPSWSNISEVSSNQLSSADTRVFKHALNDHKFLDFCSPTPEVRPPTLPALANPCVHPATCANPFHPLEYHCN
jgi:hypothetical protein